MQNKNSLKFSKQITKKQNYLFKEYLVFEIPLLRNQKIVNKLMEA